MHEKRKKKLKKNCDLLVDSLLKHMRKWIIYKT